MNENQDVNSLSHRIIEISHQINDSNDSFRVYARHYCYFNEIRKALEPILSQFLNSSRSNLKTIAPSLSVDSLSQFEDPSGNLCGFDAFPEYMRVLMTSQAKPDDSSDIFPKILSSFNEYKDFLNDVNERRFPQSFSTSVAKKSKNAFDFPIYSEFDGKTENNYELPIQLISISSPVVNKVSKHMIPSENVLSPLSLHFDHQNPIKSLSKYYEKLKRTQKELMKELTRLKGSFSLYNEYLTNPPYDLIRESPIYQDCTNAVSLLLPEVFNQQDSFDKTLSFLYNKAKSFYGSILEYPLMPTDQIKTIEALISEESQYNYEQRKLLLNKQASSNMNVLQPNFEPLRSYFLTEQEMLLSAQSVLEDGEHVLFSQIINEFKHDVSKMKENIKSEIDRIKQHEQSQNILLQRRMRENPKKIDTLTLKNLSALRDRVKQFENKVLDDEKSLHYKLDNVQNIYAELNNRFKNLKVSTAQLDTIIRTNSINRAEKRWMLSRIEQLENQNSVKKDRIKDKLKQIDDMKKEIETRKNQINSYQKGKPRISSQYSLESLTQMIQCPICQKNRDAIIMACGHTFCKNCAFGLLSSRNRNCPSCQTRFTQYEVLEFRYSNEDND